MKIIKYKTILNQNNHNILVEESSSEYYESEDLVSPEIIVKMLNNCYGLNRLAEEHLYMIALSATNKPLGVFEVSHGKVDGTYSNPREIFIRLLLSGACNFILSHNHPSGDSSPSNDDIINTTNMKKCADMMGINFIDHIIIAGETYNSLYESGILK